MLYIFLLNNRYRLMQDTVKKYNYFDIKELYIIFSLPRKDCTY